MKKILFLNWRDPWHPQAGGAELVTLRIAEGLAARGWYVEWFSAAYSGAKPFEVCNGVRYVRAGGQATVHLQAFMRYRRTTSRFSVIIDEINTIPFYTVLYSRTKTMGYINQLAQEVWVFEAPAPLGKLGAWLEPVYLAPYRRAHMITISQSSAQSLRAAGFTGRIDVIPMAVDDTPDPSTPVKADPPEIIGICRMTPSKRVEHMISGAGLLSRRGWRGVLHLIGGGDARYLRRLRALAAKELPGRIVFHGRVSFEKRTELLKRSSVLWLTSVREGWGLVVTEAACHWTPAVVYDVPGAQDSVIDGVTGKVVQDNVQALVEGTWQLLGESYCECSRLAYEHAGSFSWQRTIDSFESILTGG